MATKPSLSRPGVPAIASLAVNALLIAMLLTLGAGRRDRPEGPSLTVLSLAALKGSEEGEERAPTAEPQPEAATSAPAPPSPPSPPTTPAIVPPPSLASLPSTLTQTAPASQTATAASTPAAERGPAPSSPAVNSAAAAQGSSAAAAPQRRGIAEGLDADAPPGRSLAYAARVRSWLYAHKIYPRRARMRHEEGVVRVRFILDRTGALIEGMIVAGSGKSALDEEAVAMMHRASPYPRAPAEVGGERLEFTAPIEFMLPV